MQDRFRSSLPNAVVRLFRLINRVHNRGLKPTGISAEQAHVLSLLWLFGPLTIGQLQRMLALSSATMTGSIDRMEAQELVRRVPSPDDGRAFLLEPLPSARKRAQVEAILEADEERSFSVLTGPERKELARLLDKVIEHLES